MMKSRALVARPTSVSPSPRLASRRHGRPAGHVGRRRGLSATHRAALLRVGDGPRRADGARLHDVLHHGPGLPAGRNGAWPTRRPAGGLVCVLARRGGLGRWPRSRSRWPEHGALHVLSPAPGTPALLHRRHAARDRLLDLGRRHDCELSIVAARPRRRAGAARDPRHARDDHRAGTSPPSAWPWRCSPCSFPGRSAGWRRSIRCSRGRSSGGSGTRWCTSGCSRPTCSGTRCCRGSPADGCSATGSPAWCSSSSSCSRRRSASTTSSRIRASAPAGSWRTRSRPTRSCIRAW